MYKNQSVKISANLIALLTRKIVQMHSDFCFGWQKLILEKY